MPVKLYKASAGSGKTYRITGEYLKLLFSFSANYKHILAVTFTNKATEEMKHRVMRELYLLASNEKSSFLNVLMEQTGKNENEVRLHARYVLSLMLHDYSRFFIQTIDSFFQQIIRSFAKETGLPFGFNIETDTESILTEICEALLNDIAVDENLKKWIMQFTFERAEGGKAWNIDDSIRTLGREIFKEEFKKFGQETIDKIKDKNFLHEYLGTLNKIVDAYEKSLAEKGSAAMELISLNGFTVDDFTQKARGVAGFFKKLSEGEIPEANSYVLKAAESAENWSSKNTQRYNEIVTLTQSRLFDMLHEILSFIDTEKIKYNSSKIISANIYNLGILTDLLYRYKSYIAEKNMFPISDSAKFISDIIDNNDAPFIYEKTGSFFRYYMIDEFQDTSGLQWSNFKPLFHNSLAQNNDNLIVGDVKQSIYRWRSGDWKILAGGIEKDMRNYLQTEVLSNNWRSSSEIIHFNNEVFASAADIVQNHLIRDIENIDEDLKEFISTAVSKAYADVKQGYSGDAPTGFISAAFIENSKDSDWELTAFENMVQQIEQLQSMAYKASDMAILVRTKSEGRKITDYLLNYKNSDKAKTGISYNVVSNEALQVSSSLAVGFIVGVLRYIVKPDDLINKAFIVSEFLSLRKSGIEQLANTLEAINTDSTISVFPEDFESKILNNKSYSLFELTENIIKIFSLGETKEELPYLLAFQDMIQDFSLRESSEIGSFIDWWDLKGNEASLQLPEKNNAIKILTIHKSKGLEFKCVLIPLCNWKLDHDPLKTNFLWCTTNEEPFSALDLIPVRYSSKLKETVFRNDYYLERMQAYVDNLNLLYVALTRAKNVLSISMPVNQEKGGSSNELKSVSDLLQHIFLKPENLGMEMKDDKAEGNIKLYSGGTISENSNRENIDFNGFDLHTYKTSSPNNKIAIKGNREQLFSETGQRFFGKLIHSILEKIVTKEDIDIELSAMLFEGKISSEEKKELHELLLETVNHPAAINWFNGSCKVFNERSILLPDGSSKRPDRIMISECETIVVDYKSGERNPQHKMQIQEYCSLLNEMGYKNIRAYLWYILTGEVDEVML